MAEVNKKRQLAAKNSAKKAPRPRKLTPKQRAQLQHIEERRSLVSQYNLSGASLRQIAQLATEKGYPCSHVTVREDLEAIFEEEKRQQFSDVETLRIIGNRQLNAVMLALWSHVVRGKVSEIWAWHAIFSKWCELNGVDKPKQVDVNIDAKGALAEFLGMPPEDLPDELAD
ncbi:MAG: helix-turn-helix domain-containing protein [Acidobacteriota bacterium]|nr:helix-turn-helix domain-containing protein [Acidobacteriota bacterium]